ncbi:MAG TPA: universal stress protein, partial [Pirellulales bacterium]
KAATLLVRPHETVPKHGHPLPTRRLLIALDGSKESEAMLATAVELGEAVGAKFTLLQVIDFAAYYGADPAEVAACYPEVAPMQELQTKAAAYLEELAEPLRRRGLHVQTRAVIHSDPAAMILQQAHDLHCDLIALESRGEAGLARLMLGSVEDAIVRYGKTAVLTHSAAAGAPGAKH